jgi:hypothetical protein
VTQLLTTCTKESKFLRFEASQFLTPALLRPILDNHQTSDKATGRSMATGHVQRKTPRMRCSCPSCNCSTYSVGTAYCSGCEVLAQDKRVISLFKKRTFHTWNLNFSVRASLTITKGAGCFTISPHIEFRSVVPLDSPVFSLLKDTEKGLGSPKADFVIGSTHKKLLQLFRERKASYSDTLSNGDTILHVSGLPMPNRKLCPSLRGGLYLHKRLSPGRRIRLTLSKVNNWLATVHLPMGCLLMASLACFDQ